MMFLNINIRKYNNMKIKIDSKFYEAWVGSPILWQGWLVRSLVKVKNYLP